jgi:hypothetical protein
MKRDMYIAAALGNANAYVLRAIRSELERHGAERLLLWLRRVRKFLCPHNRSG